MNKNNGGYVVNKIN